MLYRPSRKLNRLAGDSMSFGLWSFLFHPVPSYFYLCTFNQEQNSSLPSSKPSSNRTLHHRDFQAICTTTFATQSPENQTPTPIQLPMPLPPHHHRNPTPRITDHRNHTSGPGTPPRSSIFHSPTPHPWPVRARINTPRLDTGSKLLSRSCECCGWC